MNFNIMDCILPVTWGVGVATIIWLFRKGNVENAAKSVAADRLIPTPEQTFSLMKCRRSISPKDYVPGGNVSTQDLNRMLEAANWAPTHGKTQPWHYVILSGTRAIQRYLDFISDWYIMRADTIAEGKLSSVRRKYEKLSEFWPGKVCHVALIIMRRQALPDKRMPEWEEMCATACSVQNLHLMATSMGIGGYWSSQTWCKDAWESEDVKEHFNISKEDRFLGAFTIGQVDPSTKFRSTRRPILDTVEFRDH